MPMCRLHKKKSLRQFNKKSQCFIWSWTSQKSNIWRNTACQSFLLMNYEHFPRITICKSFNLNKTYTRKPYRSPYSCRLWIFVERQHSSVENCPCLSPVLPENGRKPVTYTEKATKSFTGRWHMIPNTPTIKYWSVRLSSQWGVSLPDFLAVVTHFCFVEDTGFLQVLHLNKTF